MITRERYCRAFLAVSALVLLSLAGLPQVAAQGNDYSKFTMHGGVGLLNPLGDSSDVLNTGYTVTIGGGYNFSKQLGLVAEYNFHRPGFDQSMAKSLANGGVNDEVVGTGKIWAFTGNPVFRMNRPGKVNFYVIAGAGIYQRRLGLSITTTKSTGATTTSRTLVNTGFGINFGGGATWEMFQGFKGYVEARYHHAFTDGTDIQLVPISVGIRW